MAEENFSEDASNEPEIFEEEKFDVRLHWATNSIKSSDKIIERYFKENS